jgi:hypothetical protein
MSHSSVAKKYKISIARINAIIQLDLCKQRIKEEVIMIVISGNCIREGVLKQNAFYFKTGNYQ